MPKFSIIIPVYNVAPYLCECLDSVAVAAENLSRVEREEQVEVICVDDGSTDESGTILDEYAKRDSRIRVIHQANTGVSAARNRALEEATGEWLVFVDADDRIKAGSLRSMAKEIKAHPKADMIVFGFETFDDNGIRGSRIPNVLYSCSFWQFCYRKERVRTTRFPPYVVGEDFVYLLRCLRRARAVESIPEVFYQYRKRHGSAMNSKWSARKRWDDLRHVIHCLGILLTSRGVPLRIYARYVRRLSEKLGRLVLA